MSLFENFPYTNLHELNIDWLINELKMVKESAVISVNGQTGEVILYEDADIEFPATDNGGWDIIRKVDGTVNAGIRFTGDGVAYLITGSRVRQMYDADHQPPYPVTSVNGETGAVTITPPVSSVNGQTGAVVLYQEQYVHLPDLTGEQLQNWNFYRNINNILHGIQFDTDGRAYIMNGAGRYQIYTEHNAQPFTFVDNVNAGVMEISQAAPAGVWGLLRETDSGTAGIVFSYDSTEPTAYLRYITGSGEQAVVHNVKLLTPDDIPSSSGVLSINGMAGVVVITGSDINYKTGSTLKIGSMIDSILESVGNLANLTTTDKTSLVNAVNELVSAIGTVNTNITNLGNRISNAESTVGIVQTGATATQNISAGQYVIWNDALYKASTNISSGDTLSGTNLNAVSDGIANELNSNIPQCAYNLQFSTQGSKDINITKTGTYLFCVRANPATASDTLLFDIKRGNDIIASQASPMGSPLNMIIPVVKSGNESYAVDVIGNVNSNNKYNSINVLYLSPSTTT